MKLGFYRAFEDKYRGSRELIKSRLRTYFPFLIALKEVYGNCKALDVGCGRGEWLELLRELGIDAHGVDLDDGMLAACHALGLSAEIGEAISYIKSVPSESLAVVSGFHFAEHIPFTDLQIFVQEALRVLKPAGLLILETPNPENIVVGTSSFYLDPTHEHPIPPQLLSFLPEYYGFYRTKILRLQESQELRENPAPSLLNVFSGVSPDYSIVAQKKGSKAALSGFQSAFELEYGITLDELAARYDGLKKTNLDQVFTEKENLQAELNGVRAELGGVRAELGGVIIERTHLRAELDKVVADRAETGIREATATARAERAETGIREATARAERAETGIREATARAERVEIARAQLSSVLQEVYESNSWKITSPLRAVGSFARWFYHGTVAWLTFAPSSRPRRVAKSVLLYIRPKISAHPTIKAFAMILLSPFPKFRKRLAIAGDLTYNTPPVGAQSQPVEDKDMSENLTSRARTIYLGLQAAMERNKEE